MPKQDFFLRKPLLNAAGSLGFAPDLRYPLDWESFGAFVTNPISLRPRLPAEHPALVEYPGGVLLHSGLPNPGFRKARDQYSRSWKQSPLPVIVNLMADRPEETRQMIVALEGQDNILAAELGFAPLLADDLVLLATEMGIGEVPLIVSLPPDQVLRLGPQIEALGAAAVSICPPRGTLISHETAISGRLYGPALFPISLELVRSASKLGLTIIGAGGVASAQDAEAMLSAGALAVEQDLSLWIPPGKAKSPVN